MYISQNDYEIDKLSAVYKIKKEENYPDEIYVVTAQEIKEMYAAGEIKDIDR